ncbi:hypothetical protein J6590_045606 [Homalodisca vitripennis]|nr:hypothetical protein J6590_045606 [Homalodisca vitripennis]
MDLCLDAVGLWVSLAYFPEISTLLRLLRVQYFPNSVNQVSHLIADIKMEDYAAGISSTRH